MLLISKSHKFANRKVISVDELKNETFITLGDNNPTTDYFVETLCGAYGFKPKKILKANYFTRISYLKQNEGVVLISNLGLEKNFINDGTVHKIKVSDTQHRRYQAIAWKNNVTLSSSCLKFLNIVQEYFRNGDL